MKVYELKDYLKDLHDDGDVQIFLIGNSQDMYRVHSMGDAWDNLQVIVKKV